MTDNELKSKVETLVRRHGVLELSYRAGFASLRIEDGDLIVDYPPVADVGGETILFADSGWEVVLDALAHVQGPCPLQEHDGRFQEMCRETVRRILDEGKATQ